MNETSPPMLTQEMGTIHFQLIQMRLASTAKPLS